LRGEVGLQSSPGEGRGTAPTRNSEFVDSGPLLSLDPDSFTDPDSFSESVCRLSFV